MIQEHPFLKDFSPGDLNDVEYARYFFAVCSFLAYGGDEIAHLFEAAGFPQHKLISHEGAQCHVISNRESIVWIFRGTEPTQKSDIWADLKAWKVKSEQKGLCNPMGSVHAGFKEELGKIYVDTEATIADNKKKLYITGHSLGGGMATLAAGRQRQRCVYLYTYGSPRIGNREYGFNFNVNYFRVQNNNDIVPRMPPWILGYKHIGTNVYINHYGYIRKLGVWQTMKDKMRGHITAMLKFEFFDGMRDHGSSAYAKYLWREWDYSRQVKSGRDSGTAS